ncbi:hypothetical protein EON65_38960, partial [archaeon]
MANNRFQMLQFREFPNSPSFAIISRQKVKSYLGVFISLRVMINQDILVALRKELAVQGLDAFVIGSEDRHQSEYVCEADMRRAFVSNFTGSAGTAVVTQDKALLWTDGRYFLQAEQQLTSDWTLMKSGNPGVPDMNKWILDNFTAGQVVGVDAWLVATSAWRGMERSFSTKEIVLKAVDTNPVDLIWN